MDTCAQAHAIAMSELEAAGSDIIRAGTGPIEGRPAKVFRAREAAGLRLAHRLDLDRIWRLAATLGAVMEHMSDRAAELGFEDSADYAAEAAGLLDRTSHLAACAKASWCASVKDRWGYPINAGRVSASDWGSPDAA